MSLRDRNARGAGSSQLGFLFGGDASEERGVSSNRFASGSNQNSGNVITDRPSTKVHHAPGGKTSISIFGGADDAAPARRGAPAAAAPHRAPAAEAGFGARPAHASSNAFASGANQNSGNFITDRPTTKIHHAPGGATSIDLFGGSGGASSGGRAPPARRTAAAAAAAAPERSAPRGPIAAPARASGAGAAPARASGAGAAAFGARPAHASSNAFASGANQNSGNFITDRPTTKVHHAPGGKSSLNLFAWGE